MHSGPTDCQANAPISCDTKQCDGQTGVAAASGLWEGQGRWPVTEVAVATVVLLVLLPSLMLRHVPAGLWAAAVLDCFALLTTPYT